MKRKIYPRIDGVNVHLGLVVPTAIVEVVEKLARMGMTSKSAVVRDLLLAGMRAKGFVATEAEMAESD